MLSLQSFLRKGVSLGYVGLNQNLKDIKVFHAPLPSPALSWGSSMPPGPSASHPRNPRTCERVGRGPLGPGLTHKDSEFHQKNSGSTQKNSGLTQEKSGMALKRVGRGPLGPLGFECSQHRQTLGPTVDGTRSKALRPFGLQ